MVRHTTPAGGQRQVWTLESLCKWLCPVCSGYWDKVSQTGRWTRYSLPNSFREVVKVSAGFTNMDREAVQAFFQASAVAGSLWCAEVLFYFVSSSSHSFCGGRGCQCLSFSFSWWQRSNDLCWTMYQRPRLNHGYFWDNSVFKILTLFSTGLGFQQIFMGLGVTSCNNVCTSPGKGEAGDEEMGKGL